jgi:hypothetical protein
MVFFNDKGIIIYIYKMSQSTVGIYARTVGIRGDGDGGRNLPEAENRDWDGKYFKW